MLRHPQPWGPVRVSDYLDPYRKAVRVHGAAFESLLWNSPEFQQTRFAALVDMIDPDARVIADMGSGRGDLAIWMHQHRVAYQRIIGVEAIEELLAYAQSRAEAEPIPRTTWVRADFAEDQAIFGELVRSHGADTFVFSGSLNTFSQRAACRVLHTAWTALERTPSGALAFNFLSGLHRQRGRNRTGPAHRFDTIEMIRWASSRTPVFAVRHDYLGDHDATIVMRRP